MLVTGDADDQAAAFDGLDEEELDDGAWGGEPDIDIGDEDEEIAEAGNEYDLGEGGEDDEDGGWEMEVRDRLSLASGPGADPPLSFLPSMSIFHPCLNPEFRSAKCVLQNLDLHTHTHQHAMQGLPCCRPQCKVDNSKVENSLAKELE